MPETYSDWAWLGREWKSAPRQVTWIMAVAQLEEGHLDFFTCLVCNWCAAGTDQSRCRELTIIVCQHGDVASWLISFWGNKMIGFNFITKHTIMMLIITITILIIIIVRRWCQKLFHDHYKEVVVVHLKFVITRLFTVNMQDASLEAFNFQIAQLYCALR